MLFMILTSVIGILIISLIVITVCYPKVYANLMKLIFKPFRRSKGHQEENKKAKNNSPEYILSAKIEALERGQTLVFRIDPKWGAIFISVELNMSFPQNGSKYLVRLSNSPNDLSNGKKTVFYDSDDTLFIAKSIIEREGVLFVPEKTELKVKQEVRINSDKGKKLVETEG